MDHDEEVEVEVDEDATPPVENRELEPMLWAGEETAVGRVTVEFD